jgi:UDP-N-acetyl-D-galactosamine dehydrogenase
VFDLYKELKAFHIEVDMIDSLASQEEVKDEYNVELKADAESGYDVIIVAVAHDAYKQLEENYFKKLSREDAILVDIKSLYKSKISSMNYWTL